MLMSNHFMKGREIMILDESKLTLAMANACMNAYALCEAADIQYQTYRRVIKGKPCKPATAGNIAAALGVRVEELIERREEKE